MNIVGKRNWYFAFSLLIIIPGVISLLLWGLNLSIDFTGGSNTVLIYPNTVTTQNITAVKKSLASQKIELVSLQESGKQITFETKPMTSQQDDLLLKDVQKETPQVKQDQFET